MTVRGVDIEPEFTAETRTVRIRRVTLIVLLSSLVASGVRDSTPVRHNGSRVHIIATQQSVDVSPELKRLAATMRVDEGSDRPVIVAWILKQSTLPSAVGKVHSAVCRD